MKQILCCCALLFLTTTLACSENPVITAEQYIDHLIEQGKISQESQAPDTVLVCYGSAYQHLVQTKGPFLKTSPSSHLHVLPGNRVGILGGIGVGGPALAHATEQLIALGTKRILIIGLAGSLYEDLPIGSTLVCSHALKDDGFSVLYAPEGPFAEPSSILFDSWLNFACDNHLASHPTTIWSFPSLFLQTPARIRRARAHGCSAVEMETATLYAMARNKNVEALSLIIVSDCVGTKGWKSAIKTKEVEEAVNRLADAALLFAATER